MVPTIILNTAWIISKEARRNCWNLLKKTHILKQAAMEFCSSNQSSFDNDEEEIIQMLGIRKIPDEINIHPPSSILKLRKEWLVQLRKLLQLQRKKTRICTGCNQYVNHNWRTCKVRLARESKQP
uniref:Uncharacterized protein n=1 Tax=Lactuca sativa TaxID=4236 RepID=A0A9R1XR68_LACSA|nr:hypothetical protein LSAT_V11C200055320 [Lactuca sativa]